MDYMFVILLCYTINYGIVSMVTILFLNYTHHMLFVVGLDLPFVVVAKWLPCPSLHNGQHSYYTCCEQWLISIGWDNNTTS